jgi:rRNA processing protein Krr1/Pno1
MLIGPKGATLLALQSGCGVLIDIPKRDTQEQHITIKGGADGIARARANIRQLVEQGYCPITHPNVFTDTISVPVQSHGVLIGPGGSNIRAIQIATDVKVIMPDRKLGGTSVKLLGTREQCNIAKQAIRQLVQYSYSSITHPGYVQQQIPFPYERIAELIGTRGQTIKSIQGNTRTKINIPDNNDRRPTVNVVVVGEQAGVAQAHKQILQLLVEPTEEEEQEMMAKEAAREARRVAKGETVAANSTDMKNRVRGIYSMDAGDPMANDDNDDLDDDAASYVYRRPQANTFWGADDDDDDAAAAVDLNASDDAIFAPESPSALSRGTATAEKTLSAADKVRAGGKPW